MHSRLLLWRISVSLCLGALAAASPGEVSAAEGPSVAFDPYVAIPMGSKPEAVAIGDVNGDSRLDVAVVTSSNADPENDHSLHVFLQQADGSLLRQAPVYLGGSPESVDIGDVTGDGRRDVVAGSTGNGVVIVAQSPAGTLLAPVSVPAACSRSVRIGDFDSDGRQDVVGLCREPGSPFAFDVLLQQEDGTLQLDSSHSATTVAGEDDLDVGDPDGDGRDDVIVLHGYDTYLSASWPVQIFRQDPPPPFSLHGAFFSYDTVFNGIGTGDVNSDGHQELVVSAEVPDFPMPHLEVWSAIGVPALLEWRDTLDAPQAVEVADVNSDGREDIVVVHGGGAAMSVFLQTAAGGLDDVPPVTLPYVDHYNPHGLAIGDVNGDNRADVVIADAASGLVLLYGSPSVPSLATDWGDAPDPPYPTKAVSDGARHTVGVLQLGAHVDVESGAHPTAAASGDDRDGIDDEDGVVLSRLILGSPASAEVAASGAGYLDAWVDFNQDGDWSDAGETIFTSEPVAAGQNVLDFAVPPGAAVGETYARFRLSSLGGLGVAGSALDGEVEDYRVETEQVEIPPPSAESAVFKNLVRVRADGNSLTKKGRAPKGWNAGASSTQQILFGDGLVEFSTDEAGTKKMCGLGHDDASPDHRDIDFAFFLTGSTVKIRESGVIRSAPSGDTAFATFVPGDRFQVRVEGGVVTYWHNDSLLYTSELPAVYPLEVDTSLYDPRATITAVSITRDPRPVVRVTDVAVAESDAATTEAVFTFSLSAPATWPIQVPYSTADLEAEAGEDYAAASGTVLFEPGGELAKTVSVEVFGDRSIESDERFELRLGDVFGAHFAVGAGIGTILDDDCLPPRSPAWTRLTGVAETGDGTLTKTSQTTGWKSGASSADELFDGDGYVEFSTNETGTVKAAGLSRHDTSVHYDEIDFAFYLANGRIKISERGVLRTNSSGRTNFGRFVAGDRFRVAVEGGEVVYRHNGNRLYASGVAPSYPLVVDTAFKSPGATLADTVIFPPPPLPAVSVLDESGAVSSPSLAIGADGLGLIAYRAGKKLRAAHCLDPDCSGADVAAVTGSFGSGIPPSIAIGADGLGLIAYFTTGLQALKVVHCKNAGCTARSRRALATFGEKTINPSRGVSVTVGGDGLGLIAFADPATRQLRVAHCLDARCSAADFSEVDSGIYSATSIAATVGLDGYGLVAYYKAGEIKVAHCADAACSSATVSTLAAGIEQSPVSVAIGRDGLGLVAYGGRGASPGPIQVAHCSDAACSGATVSTISSFQGSVGAMAIGRDGRALVVFGRLGDYQIAHCDDLSCASAAVSPLGASADPTLAIGSKGLGQIAFTAGNLQIVRCQNLPCEPGGTIPPETGWR